MDLSGFFVVGIKAYVDESVIRNMIQLFDILSVINS